MFLSWFIESTTPTSCKIGFAGETQWGNIPRKWNSFSCYLKWLFFQETMWNTVETMKRAQSPTPYIHAVIFSQRSSESRWSRALPTMAGTMRNWQNKKPLSGPCRGATHRAAPAGRELSPSQRVLSFRFDTSAPEIQQCLRHRWDLVLLNFSSPWYPGRLPTPLALTANSSV